MAKTIEQVTMQAYKIAATVSENGTLVLRGLPFQAGRVVEVIVLEHISVTPAEHSPQEQSPLDHDYLLGVETQMSEWASAEDEAAYHDL